jgi:hypothetical protein
LLRPGSSAQRSAPQHALASPPPWQALSESELSLVLTEPRNALSKQYAGIFSKNDCKFHITEVHAAQTDVWLLLLRCPGKPLAPPAPRAPLPLAPLQARSLYPTCCIASARRLAVCLVPRPLHPACLLPTLGPVGPLGQRLGRAPSCCPLRGARAGISPHPASVLPAGRKNGQSDGDSRALTPAPLRMLLQNSSRSTHQSPAPPFPRPQAGVRAISGEARK